MHDRRHIFIYTSAELCLWPKTLMSSFILHFVPISKCWFSSCTLMTQQNLSGSLRNLQKTVYLAHFLQPPTATLVFGSLKLPESDALLDHPHDQKGIKNKPATTLSEGVAPGLEALFITSDSQEMCALTHIRLTSLISAKVTNSIDSRWQ